MDMMSLRRRVMVNQNKLMTATGNPITFNTPLTKPLKECVARFTPKQEGSGTPSPENVREIVGRNGITVWQSGKNLLNPNDANWGQYTINPTGGHVEETDRICSGYIPCNEGDTYTFSGSVMGSLSYVMNFVGIAGFDKDKTYVNRSMANHVTEISYTVPNGVKYIRVFEEAPKYPNITMAIWCNTLKRQLEIGSTPTEYEPFTAVETSVLFPAVGKNLFDGEWRKGRYVDGVWTTTNTWRTSELIPVEPNTTYCVSVDEPRTIGKIYCNLFDRNGNWIGSDYGTSVTTTADTALISICNTNNVVSAWTDIQLEKGSTATAYEPFDNTVYGGYVDISKGELVAEYYKVPTSAFVKYRQNNGYIAYYYRAPDFKSNIPWFCNLISEYASFSTSNMTKNIIQPQRVGGTTYLVLDETVDVSTLEIVYPLAKPIRYSLSPRILTTLKGQNVMWSDANGDITIKYWTR